LGKEKVVKTVRFNLPRAALLAAVAGLLAAVGLLVVLEVQPAEANYPGTNGKIAYAGYDGNDSEIYTINAGGGARNNSPTTPRTTATLTTRPTASG
jgi:hypothetical protein